MAAISPEISDGLTCRPSARGFMGFRSQRAHHPGYPKESALHAQVANAGVSHRAIETGAASTLGCQTGKSEFGLDQFDVSPPSDSRVLGLSSCRTGFSPFHVRYARLRVEEKLPTFMGRKQMSQPGGTGPLLAFLGHCRLRRAAGGLWGAPAVLVAITR